MRWEELTGDEFAQAVETCAGVCLLPLACLEHHAHHLPLGTDAFIAREVCRRAALLEPAVVFPDFLFTQILEARHMPGAVAIEPDLALRLLESACREISRNGLKKIVLVNGHGGNTHMLRFFTQMQLAARRDYVVYFVEPRLASDDEAAIAAQWETTVDGHAGESETSQMLAIRPDLVQMERLQDDGEGQRRGGLRALREASALVGAWFYAEHPTHYCGDGRPATAEKGERVLAAQASALARAVRAIKADEEARRLQGEFFDAAGA
jgi:creatinine amidohydrolase